MNKIGVLYHPKLSTALAMAADLRRHLDVAGVEEVWVASAWDELGISANAPGSRMVITLGGDGTILRAARAVAPLGVPILAVNLGKVGFMAELSPEDLLVKLPVFLEGKAWIEERLMLQANLTTGAKNLTARSVDGQSTLDPNSSFHALNEVVVARGERLRVIYVNTAIDGEVGPSYVADGVIVATPTGSTGYSLAVGGPIMYPELQSIILTPIAPHLSVTRSLVLPDSATVELDLRTDHGAVFSVDGQVDVHLENGDRIKVTKSPYVTKLLRAQPRAYFYKALAARLK